MKNTLHKNLLFSLIALAFAFPVAAFADGDQGSQAPTGTDGLQASATVDTKNADPASCVGCKNARAAASVGGTIATTPGEYAPTGSTSKSSATGHTDQ